ncbi:protein RIC-3 [Tachysurus ichikawai]
MLVSGIQRITLFCCLVLSVTLFLPKLFLSGGKEKVLLQSDALGPGSPPVLRFRHGASTEEDDPRSTESLCASQKPEIFSQTKIFPKSSLLSRVTPIYGFGIFLYIIYIFYKLTDKDQGQEQCCSFSIQIPEHTEQEPCGFFSSRSPAAEGNTNETHNY